MFHASSYCGCSCCSKSQCATGRNTVVTDESALDKHNTKIGHAGSAVPEKFCCFAEAMKALVSMLRTKSRYCTVPYFLRYPAADGDLDVHPGTAYTFGEGGDSSGTGGPGTREKGYNGGHLAGSWPPVSMAFESNSTRLWSSSLSLLIRIPAQSTNSIQFILKYYHR